MVAPPLVFMFPLWKWKVGWIAMTSHELARLLLAEEDHELLSQGNGDYNFTVYEPDPIELVELVDGWLSLFTILGVCDVGVAGTVQAVCGQS